MTDRKRIWVLMGVALAAGLGAAATSFAQVQHKMQLKVEPPKAVVMPTGNWLPKSVAYIKASNTNKDDQFGGAVALSGDGNTLAVGAVNEDGAGKGVNPVTKGAAKVTNSGAVYIYTRTAASWKQQAYLKASNAGEGYQFGSALSLTNDGNLLAVGSIGEASSAIGVNGNQNDASMPGAGAVYIFARNGANWSQQAYVKSSNTGGPVVGYQFGYSVSLSSDGSTLAAGQTSDPSNATGIDGDQKNTSAPDSGAVFVFAHEGDSWTQQAYVKPWNTTQRGVLFGYSVGLSRDGDTMGVGTYDEDRGRGAVYVFTRKNKTWAQQIRLTASNAEGGDSLGCSLAISDDGNTIVSGAFDEDSILPGIQPPNAGANDAADDTSSGAAYIFVRKDGKWSQQAYVKAFNTRENDQFGWALAVSRDGNTIAIGSHLEDSGAKGINGDMKDTTAEDSGAAYVYTRSGDTWNPAAYVKASNTKPAAEFGIAVALNADGKVLAVGATKENSAAKGVNGNQKDVSMVNAGAAYVYSDASESATTSRK
ncbi:MAG: integrin [Acidobacteria bacterium]|nr:MAG: integrin [Acidobacteriota bacterium]